MVIFIPLADDIFHRIIWEKWVSLIWAQYNMFIIGWSSGGDGDLFGSDAYKYGGGGKVSSNDEWTQCLWEMKHAIWMEKVSGMVFGYKTNWGRMLGQIGYDEVCVLWKWHYVSISWASKDKFSTRNHIA